MPRRGRPPKINPKLAKALEKWEFHFSSWKNSGMTQKKYCQHMDISYWSFIEWRKKLKGKISPVKAVSPKIVQLEISQSNPVINQSISSNQSSIRIWVNDFCVEVDNHFSPETLSQLIEVLRSRRCG